MAAAFLGWETMSRRKRVKIIKPTQYEVSQDGELFVERTFGWARQSRHVRAYYYGFTGDVFQNIAIIHCGHYTAIYPWYIEQFRDKPIVEHERLSLKYAYLSDALDEAIRLCKPDLKTITVV